MLRFLPTELFLPPDVLISSGNSVATGKTAMMGSQNLKISKRTP